MRLFRTLRVALRALSRHKMRAGLTVLGIVIGVAAVILLVSVSQSAGQMIQNQFQALGTNMIIVVPGSQSERGVRRKRGTMPSITAADCEAMSEECPAVLAASPIVGAGGQLVAGNLNWVAREITGVNTQYPIVRNWQVADGGFFSERDVRSAAKVCVVGWTVVENLFPDRNPLGKTMRIGNVPFEIVGVLERKGANMFGEDQDNVVFAPYTTVSRRLRGSAFDAVDVVLASSRSAIRMEEAKNEITDLLRQRHRLRYDQEDDFHVQTTAEVMLVLKTITAVLSALLGSVASVSLVVGGVGIMNIMLVSVTERTREIGIRMAVGARGRDILRQFLVEAILLATLGGMLGAALGVGASVLATSVLNAFLEGSEWPVIISQEAILIAIVFSGAVGLFFGYYPARKASRLDPIEALRYE